MPCANIIIIFFWGRSYTHMNSTHKRKTMKWRSVHEPISIINSLGLFISNIIFNTTTPLFLKVKMTISLAVLYRNVI